MVLSEGRRQVFYEVVPSGLTWRTPDLGERTAVLTVHGGPGFTHRYLRPWLDALAPGYCLVYADLPGCGRSSRHPGSGYPLEAYVADLERLRRTLGLERLVLLAHGWGAILATEYALAHPGHVAALVAVNPLRILRAEGQDGEAQARMIAAVDPQVIEPYVERLWPKIQRALGGDTTVWAEIDADPWWARMWRTQFAAPPPREWETVVADIALGMESYFAHKGAAMMVEGHPLASYDLAERARPLRAPLLIVAGDSDANYVAPWQLHAQPLHAAVRGSSLALMPGTGHFPFVEDPAGFAASVAAFLARHGLPPLAGEREA
jgi:proline iminopeptidase